MRSVKDFQRVLEVLPEHERGINCREIGEECGFTGSVGAKRKRARDIVEDNNFREYANQQGYEIKEGVGKQKARLFSKKKLEAEELEKYKYRDISESIYFSHWLMPASMRALGEEAREFALQNLPYWKEMNDEKDWPIPPSVFEKAVFATNWGECQYTEKHIRWIKTFMSGIYHRQYVMLQVLSYNSSESAEAIDYSKPHTFIPMRLCYHRGTLYFLAYKPDSRQRIFLFEVESVEQCYIAHDKGQFKEDWSKEEIDGLFSQRFGVTKGKGEAELIHLRWGQLPKKKLFVEWRYWLNGKKQPTFERSEDGALEMKFEAQISRELVGWIMMWLDHVKVLGPPRLVAILKEKSRSIAAMYEEESLPKNLNHPDGF